MNFDSYYYYDDTSPSCLRWKVNRYAGANHTILKARAGDLVGSLSKRDGYWRVFLSGKSYLVHRIVLHLAHGESGDYFGDHIDGNRSNNLIENLRYVTSAGNARNLGRSPNNTSGVTGVKLTVTHNGKYANWSATVCDEMSVTGRMNRAFSINKFGDSRAFEMACAWRKSKIEELNLQGAGYTEAHGIRESH